MTGALDRPACEVYRAELEAPAHHKIGKSVLGWPIRALGALLGYIDEPPFGDVVVRRIDDSSEVLRIEVSGFEETAIGLDEVRTQLQAETIGEFNARWSLGS